MAVAAKEPTGVWPGRPQLRGLLWAGWTAAWGLFSFMIMAWHISKLMASLKAEVTILADPNPWVLSHSDTLH